LVLVVFSFFYCHSCPIEVIENYLNNDLEVIGYDDLVELVKNKGAEVGKGSWKKVYRSRLDTDSSDKYALGICSIEGVSSSAVTMLESEVKLQKKAADQSGCSNYILKVEYSYKSTRNIYIITPLGSTSFDKWIVGVHNDVELLNFFLRTIASIKCSNAASVVHWDLKADQFIVVDEKPLLSDFGLSVDLTVDGQADLRNTTYRNGNVYQQHPPDSWGKTKTIKSSFDVWSVVRMWYNYKDTFSDSTLKTKFKTLCDEILSSTSVKTFSDLKSLAIALESEYTASSDSSRTSVLSFLNS